MPSKDKRPPLVIMTGATAVGKTEISLRLCERLDMEIISADSRLFYRAMNIGTAKPSAAEQARIPHHLIDILNPDETFRLAQYQKSVFEIAAEIGRRGRLPLLLGGSGQYIRAITEGWLIPELEPKPDLRDALERQAERSGPRGLHRWLSYLDPPAAQSIDYRNVRRTIRALEVTLHTGRPFSEQRRREEPRSRNLMIGLTRPRAELYRRIDARIENMLSQGLVDEVRDLLGAGYPATLPAMTAIGYQEVARYIEGAIRYEEAVLLMKRRTRALVRRQANWFKPDDRSIHWHEMSPDPLDQIEKLIEQFLAGQISEQNPIIRLP